MIKRSHRAERLAGEIQKILSQVFLEEMKDPKLGFITITDVEVSRDLTHAKVFISNLGGEEKSEESLKALEHAKGFLRTELGQSLSLRVVPELTFEIDRSLEHSLKINAILKDLEDKKDDK